MSTLSESDWSNDPVVRELRERISEADLAILEAINERVELVRRLHEHKREQGYPLLDPERERALLEGLVRANAGPLSREGVRELFEAILALTKREVGGTPVAPATP